MNDQNLLTQTRAILAATPLRFTGLVETLPERALTRPATPGEWSVLDCLQHLLDTERLVFPVRVGLFLGGRDLEAFDPSASPYEQPAGEAPALPIRELAAEFTRLRTESLDVLDRLGASDLERTANHAELGRVTLGEMLNEWAAHDLNHTVQAERALMQDFIVGSGPWRPYFAEHDLAADRE